MDNFKLASKEKLRINTPKGLLSVEQLWDLSLDQLDSLAVNLDAEHKQSGKKSFLTSVSVKDRTAKLRFDVVLDILNTKAEEADTAQKAREVKEHNNKILELIAEKQDETLKGKTIGELKRMLK